MLILVGIGSNRGDSIRIVRASIDALRGFAAGALRQSSLWRTSPIDCPPDSDDYINAVVAFEPRADLTPEGLLAALKQLERQFGRAVAPVCAMRRANSIWTCSSTAMSAARRPISCCRIRAPPSDASCWRRPPRSRPRCVGPEPMQPLPNCLRESMTAHGVERLIEGRA